MSIAPVQALESLRPSMSLPSVKICGMSALCRATSMNMRTRASSTLLKAAVVSRSTVGFISLTS